MILDGLGVIFLNFWDDLAQIGTQNSASNFGGNIIQVTSVPKMHSTCQKLAKPRDICLGCLKPFQHEVWTFEKLKTRGLDL